MNMRHLNRAVAAAAAGTALLGACVATAPTAAAVTTKGCTWEWGTPYKETVTTAVHLRSGPGKKYTSKGILYKKVRFTEYCNRDFKWSYGKVNSGPNKGKKGWVHSDYLNP